MTTTEAPAPIASARLTDRHWVVDNCPHCGGHHAHGRGRPSEDPARYLGHAAAHCGTPGSEAGYVLLPGAPT